MTKVKNLTEIFREKGVSKSNSANVKAFLKGKKLKTIKNSYGHNQSIGTIIESTDRTYISGSALCYLKTPNGTTTMYFSDLTVVGFGDMSLEGVTERIKIIDKDIKKLQADKKDAKDQLAFLKEAGVDSFTDSEYKAYMTLKTLEKDDLTDVEKARAIAKLIDG